jgi:hypothetical protein
MVDLWRRLHPYILGNGGSNINGVHFSTEAPGGNPLSNFDIVASALDMYEMKYYALMRCCLIKHAQFSARTKFFSGQSNPCYK